MEGERHTLALHCIHEQTHALHHDYSVGSLDGDDHIEELLAHANAEKLHAALHDASRGVAIVAHDAIGERTMIHPDANGSAVFAADGEQLLEACFKTLEFCGIFFVSIFHTFEGARRINVVTRIDAHFFDDGSCQICYFRVEVHICHQWGVVASAVEFSADVAKVFRFAQPLCGQAHEVCTSLNDADALFHASFRVCGQCGGHALQAQRISTTYCRVSHLHSVAASGGVVKKVHEIGRRVIDCYVYVGRLWCLLL